MQADIEHAGRKQAGIVDAHGIHPAVAELHVAQRPALFGLLRAAHRITRDAAAHVLIADLGRREGAAVLVQPRHGELPEHVVFYVGQEFAVILILVMVGVDIDDDHVVEVALVRLLAGVRQQPRSVQFLDRYAATAVSDEIHCVSPGVLYLIYSLASLRAKRSNPACLARNWIASLLRSSR